MPISPGSLGPAASFPPRTFEPPLHLPGLAAPFEPAPHWRCADRCPCKAEGGFSSVVADGEHRLSRSGNMKTLLAIVLAAPCVRRSRHLQEPIAGRSCKEVPIAGPLLPTEAIPSGHFVGGKPIGEPAGLPAPGRPVGSPSITRRFRDAAPGD
jgi:hypothetical protein